MWLSCGLPTNGPSIYMYGKRITKGCPRKKPGDQDVAEAVKFSTGMPLTLHSNVCHRTAMADTTFRALRRERIGPREPPAVEGALRVRVVSIPRRCRALSPGTTCCGG